jgi:hypothetical protein
MKLLGDNNSLSQKTMLLVVHNTQNPETLLRLQLMSKACTALIHFYTISTLLAIRPQIVTRKADDSIWAIDGLSYVEGCSG